MSTPFIVSSGQLLKQLERIKGALNSGTLVPITECFLFELGPGELRLTATDLNVRLSVALEVEAVDAARLAIPGRRLLDVLKHMADQPTTFTLDTEAFFVDIVSATSTYRIAGDDARGFPQPPECEPLSEYTMSAGRFQRGLAKTVDFASTDSSRTPMDGVALRFAEKAIVFTASDGWGLLARYRQKYEGDARPVDLQVVAPARTMKLLAGVLPKTLDKATVYLCKKHIMVDCAGLLFSCQLIDSPIPAYDTMIPRKNDKVLTVDKLELLHALRRLQGFVEEKTQAVRFQMDGAGVVLTGVASNSFNEARELLLGDFVGEPLKIGLRLSNLLASLGHLDGERVQLSFGTNGSPALLYPETGNEGEQMQIVLAPLMIDF